MLSKKQACIGLAVFVSTTFIVRYAQSQQISELDRQRALQMLKIIGDEVRKHYYDPKFHGVDFDQQLAEAKQRIEKVTSMNMALANIANALDSLDDSHTFFLPPAHPIHLDYGWEYQMVGDRCFITQVRPKSDAEAKGVKPGDQILSINGIAPSREITWKLQYMFGVLRPQQGLRLGLQDPDGTQRTVDVAAHIRETKRVTNLTMQGGSDIWDVIRRAESYEHQMRARYAEFGDALIVVKLPEFAFTPSEVGNITDKIRKHKALILDLRGNPGGSVETLEYFVGDMFGKDVKIADRVGRKESRPQIAKGSSNPYAGKLIVLVDYRSASASELFARLTQLEKRGVVLGDRTSGSVMEAKHYDEKIGVDTVVFYGVSITDADLIMSDGKSLEHVGVTPDELILPTAPDLAANRDPVMVRAAELAGVPLSPADAGKMFPYEWLPE